jgi:perosamine synthetase
MEKKETINQQFNIPLFTVFMSDDVDNPLLDVLHCGYIGQGPKVDQFEKMLGEYISNQNVLTVNSATSGLHLAVRLAGVGYGDEVISTAMTCTATNMPIVANGATIKWADIDADTGLIDILDVERKITERTKAIVVVDWGGMPCDMDRIMGIGRKYNLKVIEDAAHAIGATYKGRKVGTLADFTVFSFQAIKHITTVDGGAVFCKDTEDYKRGKLLRWYGIDRETERKDFRCEEDIQEWGYKFHMNDVNAIIGIKQLSHLDEILAKHRANAAYYDKRLLSYFIKPYVKGYDAYSAYWLYTIQLPTLQERMEFMRYMKDNGIAVSQVHARNDMHTAFKDFRAILPGIEKFVERQISIPVHWRVTEDQRVHIVNTANKFALEKGFRAI